MFRLVDDRSIQIELNTGRAIGIHETGSQNEPGRRMAILSLTDTAVVPSSSLPPPVVYAILRGESMVAVTRGI